MHLHLFPVNLGKKIIRPRGARAPSAHPLVKPMTERKEGKEREGDINYWLRPLTKRTEPARDWFRSLVCSLRGSDMEVFPTR